MSTRVLINAVTVAETTEAEVIHQEQLPVSFAVSGLATGEAIVIEEDVNGTWVPIVESGTAVTLSEDNTVRKCTGVCRIRFVKPLTAGAVTLIRRSDTSNN